jgi:LemA protein
MLFKFPVKPNFTVENEAAIAAPPAVDFGTAAPAPAPATGAPSAPAPAPAAPAPAT